MRSTYILFYSLVTVFICLWTSCFSDNSKGPDVDNINIDYKTVRFDQLFFQLDSLHYKDQIKKIESQYPLAYKLYVERVLGLQATKESAVVDQIFGLSQNKGIRALRDSVLMHFSDTKDIDGEIKSLLTYYKYYFPEEITPEVVYGINEFSYGAYTYEDSIVGVGLDLFLGMDFPYNTQYFPAYIQLTMDKEHLPVHVAKAMAKNVLAPVKGTQLLDNMIYNGKVLYLASLLLPDYEPQTIMEYTDKQWAWCEDNELEVWVYLLADDLIYTHNREKQYKLIKPSPMGPSDMPPESPGRVGNWVGFQIVKKYMTEHPEIKISDLIKLNDSQAVLNKAHYRPK